MGGNKLQHLELLNLEVTNTKKGDIGMRLVLRSLVVIYFMMTMHVVNAMETIQLKSDTNLHPMGWVSGSLNFKGGTTVTINEYGEVISGMLTHYERLRPAVDLASSDSSPDAANMGYAPFKPGVTITFNEVGEVIEGTLGENTNIRSMGKDGRFVFASNSYVKFNSVTRGVETGTLYGNTYFRPNGWKHIPDSLATAGYLKFKHGTVVKFNTKGEVLSGTLAEETKLYTVDGKMKIFVPETLINFNELGQAY